MPTLEAIRKRASYKPLAERVIAVRRPPETGSAILYSADTQWIKNPRCDVYAVGSGRWGDGKYNSWEIEPGDVIWVTYHDGDYISKKEDPDLLSILVEPFELEDGRHYNGVWAVIKAKKYLSKASVVRALPLGHRMNWVNPDGTEIDGLPEDYMVTVIQCTMNPSRVGEKMVVRKEQFEDQYIEVQDGREA